MNIRIKKNIKSLLLIVVLVLTSIASISSFAAIDQENKFRYPFYIGITNGYGSTTWGNLVPKDPDSTMSIATPIRVHEGGYVGGFYAGYEIIPVFALELSYMHYPNAKLIYDYNSLFSFNHNDRTELITRTESIALVGKFMLMIPHTTGLRAYATAGAAEVHRYDTLVNRWRLSPQFGAGFDYLVTCHMMIELGTEYVAGYGRAEVQPSDHFIPFLYSGYLRLAYRF